MTNFVVKGAHFTTIICQFLSVLYSIEYKVVYILDFTCCSIHYWTPLNIVSFFLKNTIFKYRK
jgi:hypothetical protein